MRSARSVPPSMRNGRRCAAAAAAASPRRPVPAAPQPGQEAPVGGAASPRGASAAQRQGRAGRALPRGVGAGSAGSGCRARRRRRRRRQRAGRRRNPPAFEPGQSRGGERGRGRRQAMTSERPERIRWESRGSGAAEPGVSD